MGWLWACLGGGPGIQGAKSSKSLRRKLSYQPHDLRLQPLPTQLPRHGYGVQELPHLQKVPTEDVEAFPIATASVNTCISINSLRKSSERNLESSFRREFGLSMRTDVDELKEELAALRRRLANEEAEAKKLREEVSYLRSCGMLQRSEDSPDRRIHEIGVPENESAVDQADEKQQRQEGDIAPVKLLRKCFSGPMLFDSQSHDSTKDASQQSTQTRISSHRVGLSPKSHSLGEAQENHRNVDEGASVVVDTVSLPRVSKVSLGTSGLHQYPSTKVAAWTSQITEKSHMSRDVVLTDSMDVHWIEVATNAPNVRRDDDDPHAESSPTRRPKLRALMAEDDTSGGKPTAPKPLVGKRRQNSSVDLNEPTEKRSKEQAASNNNNQSPALSPEQIEEQLSQAVAAFRQQKRELEAKHQSFCLGPTATTATTTTAAAAASTTTMPGVGFFRSSRKKSHAIRHNRGFQRSLSPVKEALSIEEVTWSRQSSSRNEPSSANTKDAADVAGSVAAGEIRLSSSKGTRGFKFSAKIVEESSPVKLPPPEFDDERPCCSSSLAMVPIQCASPCLSPTTKKRPASASSSSSSGLDALCALAMCPPTEGNRYPSDDHETDWIQACDWDDGDGDCDDDDGNDGDGEVLDMKPIECASPSFSDRRKAPRGGAVVRQSISFDAKESPSSSSSYSYSSRLMASASEFTDESFLSCGKSSSTTRTMPSPTTTTSGTTTTTTTTTTHFRSSVTTPSPRKPWTTTNPKDAELVPDHRSWYCDAMDAIRSINDVRRSKEWRLLLSESVSLGNSPSAGKPQQPQQQQRPARPPPHAFSAEKRILRRAFSWYVSEHDERVRTFGLKGGRQQQQAREEEPSVVVPMRVPVREPQQQQKKVETSEHAQRGMQQHARRFSDSDSGGSATFSIDLNRAQSGSPLQALNEGGALEDNARDSAGAAASLFLQERADKENNNTLQTWDPSLLLLSSSSDSGIDKHLQHSQESVPEKRPILGSRLFNNLDKHVRTSSREDIKNPTGLYKEDTRGERHPVITLQRALPKFSSRGIPGKVMERSRSFV